MNLVEEYLPSMHKVLKSITRMKGRKGGRKRLKEIAGDCYAIVSLMLGHTMRKDTLGGSWAGSSYVNHIFFP